MLTKDQTQTLLNELCSKLGFCLPTTDQQELMNKPPKNVREFTDAVFFAERLDPKIPDRKLYRTVTDMVSQAFQRALRNSP